MPLQPTGNQVLKYMTLRGHTLDSSHTIHLIRFSLKAFTKINPKRIEKLNININTQEIKKKIEISMYNPWSRYNLPLRLKALTYLLKI